MVKRVAEVAYGLYASAEYLARRPVKSARALRDHPILTSVPGPGAVETRWLKRLAPDAAPTFTSTLSLALVGAARAGAGVAILPRYLGDGEPLLVTSRCPTSRAKPCGSPFTATSSARRVCGRCSIFWRPR